ncbi:uncharacterized protein LOC125577980 [Brassica napus]|uniref:uncharacterized protein LOC125577980 n=1 Tax=Brassica napus TaxID=3708 RepID=UPI002078AE90|nr:uncharacterized protein LOC125577980 [Brassica napus]
MGTADPPDLPLSPTKVGSSLGEAQGTDRLVKNGGDSTEVLDLTKSMGATESATDGSSDLSLKALTEKQAQVPIKSKGSYAGVVQGQKSLKKYEVEIEMKDGIDSIMVPEEITKDVAPLWDDFLIGKFLDTAPHIAKVHSIVNKIWTLNDKNQKIDVFEVNATTMKFRILNQADKNRILRRGMWNLAGVPVVMTKWSPVVEKEKPPTQSIPMWVHVKKVPLKMFSWQGLSFVTSPLGVPGRLHPETAQCLNLEVAKVFVNVDLTKDLPKHLKFNVQGEEVLVEYSYPWLPKKCEKCEKWVHTEKICSMRGEGSRNKQGDLEEGEIRDDSLEKGKEGSKEKEKDQEETSTEIQTEKGLTEIQTMEVLDNGIATGENTPEAITKGNEWEDVSPGKASRSPRELEFGQVSILTKSRFSVLTPVEEGDPPENEDKQAQSGEDGSSSDEKEEEMIHRKYLPRDSKINHRYLKGGQKAQDTSPSNLNRKKPRRQ